MALHITLLTKCVDLQGQNHQFHKEGWVVDTGIREVDFNSGETLFEWWPSGYLNPLESNFDHQGILTNANKP